jgi:hypothetical protein
LPTGTTGLFVQAHWQRLVGRWFWC